MFPALAAGLISGGLAYLGTQSQNEAAAEQAQRQMDFQRDMSGTAYQRAVVDMRAAGLNPMLAYSQGGASTPGGAMAQVQNSLGNAVSSAQVGSKLEPEIANIRAATNLQNESAEKAKADAEVARTQALVNAVQVPRIEQETRTSASSAAQTQELVERLKTENLYNIGGASALKAHSESDEARERAYRLATMGRNRAWFSEAERMEHEARRAGHEATLTGLGIPRARNEAEAQRSWWMQNISPYMADVQRGTSAASGLRMLTR